MYTFTIIIILISIAISFSSVNAAFCNDPTKNQNLPLQCRTAPACGSILSPPPINYDLKKVWSYIIAPNVDFYNNLTRKDTLLLQSNSIILTDFATWTDKNALALLICVAHLNGAQVHHWVGFDCGAKVNGVFTYPCQAYMANNGYVADVGLVSSMGADGFNIDFEGSSTFVPPNTFKNQWMKTIYNYTKWINYYVVSTAVPCHYDQNQWNTDYSDYFFAMCYDMGGNDGMIRSNSPYDTVRNGITTWKAYVNKPGKIVVGLPLYSYFANCGPMDYGLYGTTCNYNPASYPNGLPSIGLNGIYNAIGTAYLVGDGITSNSRTPYVNLMASNDAISQYQYQSPSSIYQKVLGLGVGGAGFFRVDLLTGLPLSVIKAYYVSAQSL
ncbi:hypothetical protein DFA_03923 [Cavenderia fasciculata]|uniref:GH18 domain-containing protein n=1 Tax=Cavenderia fasciculata TaxID=261658 RepID=F4Q0S8_CACFS|nr:uncharacterized protein DFA_03923 [Cavenderia fasciculata]EGG18429.1 hypothetical protein DFA_03923 [Cavenderia fasciculata]|eukprot:XP_004366333.1 hypothetical protein DFA_03923 [Cavenderia fasciculata]